MRFFLLCSVLLLSACSNAPIRLYDGPTRPATEIADLAIPVEIDVLSLNGKKVEGAQTLLGTADRRLQLLPGQYQLLVYYNNLWQSEGDSHETIRSRPIRFDLDLVAGHHYQMDFTRTRDLRVARGFATDFPVWLTDLASGQRVDGKDAGLGFDNSLLNQLTGRVVLDATGTSSDGHQVIAPLATAAATTAVAPATPAVAATPAAPLSSAIGTPSAAAATPASAAGYLDLLKAQWRQASQEEKRAFLQWLGEHP